MKAIGYFLIGLMTLMLAFGVCTAIYGGLIWLAWKYVVQWIWSTAPGLSFGHACIIGIVMSFLFVHPNSK